MHELCFLSNLSSGDWAAWATFAANLLAAMAAGLAVWASFRVAHRQEDIAERRRFQDQRELEVAALTLCREAVSDTKLALEQCLSASQARVNARVDKEEASFNPTGQVISRVHAVQHDIDLAAKRARLDRPTEQESMLLDDSADSLSDCLSLNMPRKAVVPTTRARRVLRVLQRKLADKEMGDVVADDFHQAIMLMISTRDHLSELIKAA